MKTIALYVSILLATTMCFAQKDTAVIVHEWGTFTTLNGSDGSFLSGLQREEEHLPHFVQDFDFSIYMGPHPDKGWPTYISCYPQDVKVKMETPVLYFYANHEMDFEVRVKFNNGIISQWYPAPTEVLPNIHKICQGDPGSRKPFNVGSVNGEIEWKGKVLAPNTKDTLTQPAIGWHTWLAPRATASNLIQDHKGEVEKYLFYRGMGSFNTQLALHFDTKGKLHISNDMDDALSFVMVYNKTDKGAEVWWMGSLEEKQKIAVLRNPIAGKTVAECMEGFKNALVEAGLYEDEAIAMLETWKKSYFESSGVKVFWIVPRNRTDEILPFEMQPKPTQLERVLVGRSEILTPEFEDELYTRYASQRYTDTIFRWDRYKLAYDERFEQLKTTLFNPNTETKLFYYIYPNPANEALNVYAKLSNTTTNSTVILTDLSGKVVFQEELTSNEFGEIKLNYSTQQVASGMYVISILSENDVHTERVVITN